MLLNKKINFISKFVKIVEFKEKHLFEIYLSF